MSTDSATRPTKRVCVVGAGVIGLSTAVRLQEVSAAEGWGTDRSQVPGVEVTVVADRFTPHTTSDGSGGFWEPYKLGDTPLQLIRRWSEATWTHLFHLASSPQLAGTVGAQFVSGYSVTDSYSIEEPWHKDLVLGFRRLTARELQPFPGARCGYFHTSLEVNVQKYLPWLMLKFKSAGGKVEFRKIEHLSEVARDYDVVVNCCGPRAGLLVGDTETSPIRGQLRRMKAPWIKHFYLYESETRGTSYLLPLGDVTLLGGVAQEGRWEEEVDATDSEEIWTRGVTHFPFIKEAVLLQEWAGLRPGRTTVRLEADTCPLPGTTVPVVHNYGHGGSGVTLHWGCAADAVRLVREALTSAPSSTRTPSKL